MVRKETILEAAMKLFAEKGFEGTSMQNIAEAVGLQKQSLYTHFKNKDQIYMDVIQNQMDIYTGKLDRCMDKLQDEPTDVLLMEVFKCMIASFSDHNSLLIFKRAQIQYNCEAEAAAFADMNCQVESRLRERLYSILSQRHERLSDPDNFSSFYASYLTNVQGYLDGMMQGRHNEDNFNDVWHHCWSGLKTEL
jgi:AcrR family transcriptional regulator